MPSPSVYDLIPARCALALAVCGVLADHGGWHRGRGIGARLALNARQAEPLLQGLHAAGVVCAKRGQGGGYRLAREAGLITAGEIVRAAFRPAPRQWAPERSIAALSRLASDAALAQCDRVTLRDLVAEFPPLGAAA